MYETHHQLKLPLYHFIVPFSDGKSLRIFAERFIKLKPAHIPPATFVYLLVLSNKICYYHLQ